MKNYKEFKKELPISETILLGKSIQMGDRRARITRVVSVGGTSRYDTVYKVKFQDGTQIEMHDSQIRPFLIESVELDEANFVAIVNSGKHLGDWLGKSYYEYGGKVWMLRGSMLSNQGTVAQAKKKFNKELLSKLKFESVELDELTGTKNLLFRFANKRNAEQFAYDISNSGVGQGIDYPEEGSWYVEVEPFGRITSAGRSAIKQYMKKNKGVYETLESVEESVPANAVGGGMSPHFGSEGGVQGTDPILGKKKKRKKFAGAEVFELNSDDYHTCMHGRKRYERWNRKLNMENIDNQEIRAYAHKNPGLPIVIQDKTTGIMAYLIHGDKK